MLTCEQPPQGTYVVTGRSRAGKLLCAHLLLSVKCLHKYTSKASYFATLTFIIQLSYVISRPGNLHEALKQPAPKATQPARAMLPSTIFSFFFLFSGKCNTTGYENGGTL